MFVKDRNTCKSCRAEYAKQYNKKHPEVRRKHCARYRIKNKATIAIKSAEYREKNKNRIIEYRTKNKAKIKILQSRWRKRNIDYIKVKAKEYKAKNKSLVTNQRKIATKKYEQKNRKKIAIDHRIRSRESCEKLTDGYVASQIAKRSTLKVADIPKELIELQRNNITRLRKIKEQTQ